MINNITPLILTFNEAPNIERTLRRLTWAKRIVVIDSYSSDDTIAILREFPQVDVYQREFDTFASQCNYGLRHIKTDWALSLDADYVLTDDFIEELKSLRPQESTNSYSAKFSTASSASRCAEQCIRRAGFSIVVTRPFMWMRPRPTSLLKGRRAWLSSYILHDDRKSLGRWLRSQDRYIIREVKNCGKRQSNWAWPT